MNITGCLPPPPAHDRPMINDKRQTSSIPKLSKDGQPPSLVSCGMPFHSCYVPSKLHTRICNCLFIIFVWHLKDAKWQTCYTAQVHQHFLCVTNTLSLCLERVSIAYLRSILLRLLEETFFLTHPHQPPRISWLLTSPFFSEITF